MGPVVHEAHSFQPNEAAVAHSSRRQSYRAVEDWHLSHHKFLLDEIKQAAQNKNLVFFADYDATITKRFLTNKSSSPKGGLYCDGGPQVQQFCDTCFRVVEHFSKFPDDYTEATDRLREKYFPIENDASIGREEKIPLMIEWYEGALELLVKSGGQLGGEFVVADMCKEAVDAGRVELREGVGGILSAGGQRLVLAMSNDVCCGRSSVGERTI